MDANAVQNVLGIRDRTALQVDDLRSCIGR